MVLCASFFSGIMAVLNQVRQDDDIRTRDKGMADGGIRKKGHAAGKLILPPGGLIIIVL